MVRITAWLNRQAWFGQLLRYWRPFVVTLVLLYIITGAVITRASYTQTTPSASLRSAVRFVPIPVVRVDQSFIWMNEYIERYTYIDSFIKKTATADFTPQKTRSQVVDYLVETRLITQLASQQHISVNSSNISSAYDQLGKQPGVGGSQQIEQVLRELYGMTPTAFKRLLGEQLLRERVEQQVFLHVSARHILVSKEEDANRIISELKSGKTFDDEAKQFSQDGKTRDQGGNLGMVGRGSGLPKPLEDAIFSLTPQSDLTIVKTDLGYHVLDTNERVGVIDANFSEWLNQQKHERSITVYLPTTLDWAQPKKK